MKILNLLTCGDIGGIEVLCESIGKVDTKNEHCFCFMFGEGQICAEMQAEKMNVISLANLKKFSFKRLAKLHQLCSENDIIVVHHEDIFLYFYFILFSRIFKNKKFVMMAHSCFDEKYFYYKSKLKTLLKKNTIKSVIKNADKIIFVSNAGRKSYTDKFAIPIDKMAVVYNGIGDSFFKNGKENIPILDNELRLLYVGRLEKIKGVELVINALANFKNENMKFIVVGDGSEKNNLEVLTSKLALQSIITFAGAQRNLDEYFTNANFFIYPSVCNEVFGISIVEAMAYGLPCIANAVGGIPEVIDDNQNGFLTDDLTSKAVVDKIAMANAVIKNKEKYYMMSKVAKIKAERFSIAATVENLSNVYDSLYL